MSTHERESGSAAGPKPAELLDAKHDDPDPTGALTDYEPEWGAWTIGPEGRSNTSLAFQQVVAEVERLIRQDAHMLISGHAENTAGLIVAHLAHKHGMTVEVAHRGDC